MGVSSGKRKRVYAKTNGLCWYCGVNPADSIDHIIPVRKGGTDDEENLLGACRKCNGHKMTLTIEEYRLLILNKLVKITHIERMAQGGFFATGLFYGERLVQT